MRVSTAVFCTLATLAAKDADQLAIANPLPSPDRPDSEIILSTALAVELKTKALPPSITPALPTIELGMSATSPDAQQATALVDSQPLVVDSTLAAMDEVRSLTPEPSLPAPSPVESMPVAPIRVVAEIQREIATDPNRPALVPLSIDASQIPDAMFARMWRSPAFRSPAFQQGVVTISRPPLPEFSPRAEVTQPPANPNPPVTAEQILEQTDTMPAQPPSAPLDEFGNEFEGSPAITIANPSGYGADNFKGFANFSYQSDTRLSESDDATVGLGIGVGDANEAVGLQLSYTFASFGQNRDFGTGEFNAKLHRQLSDAWSVALGWEGFATIGEVDFADSFYGTVTHVARLRPNLQAPLSRLAITAGVGNGRFRSEADLQDENETVNLFSSVALRVARPVSAIVEWTGQDLAAGLSIAPIGDFPLVITPAVRDIVGTGDAQFVLRVGLSWRF